MIQDIIFMLNSFYQYFYPILENSVDIFAIVAIAALIRPILRISKSKLLIVFNVILVPITVYIMFSSWEFTEGIRFDARWTIIGLAGYFYGWIPTLVVSVTAIVCRFIIGGVAMYSGVISIVVVAAFTILVRTFLKEKLEKITPFLRFWIYGLVLHAIALPTLLFIPEPGIIGDLTNIAIPIFGIYPLLTAFIAMIILMITKNYDYNDVILQQRRLLQAAIDSPKSMEIYVLDKNYCYLTFNDYHKYCMEKYYQVEIAVGDSFLDLIKNTKMYNRYQSELSKALKGMSFISVDEIEEVPGKYYENRFTPIRTDRGEVIGVGVFSQDVTKQKEYEDNIIYLNNHDNLTNLYNRRYYTRQLIKMDNYESMPISIVMADINGLKIINDAFGHAKGDELLVIAAELLKETFENYGFIARIGGDEFVAVLKNTSKKEALRLIDVVEDKTKDFSISGIAVSISFGLATKENDMPLDEIIKSAEDNMYKQKLFHQTSNKSEAIATILKTLHEKNKREEMHSQRVSEYCELIANLLKLSSNEVKLLKISGVLHDIGKIAISDAILNKPGKLTNYEWEQIKKHPEIGFRILSASTKYVEISNDILHHHERFDGTGYPQGLAGEDIPVGSRIIALADAYDAMTSQRAYRPTLSKEEAIKEIETNLGKQFDPYIGEIFLKYLKNEDTKKKTAK